MITEDVSLLFNKFADQFDGLNYVVIVSAKKVFLQNNEYISLEALDQVFADDDAHIKMEGTVEECAFENALAEINDVLGYQATRGGGTERCTANELERRQQIFWSLVQKYIALPPQKTYCHVAFHRSRLSFGTHWNFCYIFVNGNEALAIAMGASD